jgi:hypothetical protein
MSSNGILLQNLMKINYLVYRMLRNKQALYHKIVNDT